ncbi:hypothetical protein Scep_009449 [Stephania cephalantha]|uniref:Pentatricopeptide repeat-containing protein n=1 Tax=Stephania cephalantha TaxID=152367 RepID=A0AAP0JT76_9MAGN
MYSKCGHLSNAAKVFDEMPLRDTVSWNSMISGFLRNGRFELGFRLFKRMLIAGSFLFDQATITTFLSVCDDHEVLHLCQLMHSLGFKSGHEREVSVGNALITSYFKCGCCALGRLVFDEMVERNVITWTAAISGLAQSEHCEESLLVFLKMRRESVDPNSLTCSSSLLACSGLGALWEGREIHGLILKLGYEGDLCVGSALMDVYSKCRCMEDAWRVFNFAEELDEVSMTVILVGLAQNGSEEDAIQMFTKMVKAGYTIDSNVVSAVLGALSADMSLALGKQIHSIVIKKNFSSNTFVCNGLINMYSKCGDSEESIQIFNGMSQRNSVSWNSMIAAFARHGYGFEVLKLFEGMRSEGVEPTDVTFLSLLHACSHMGFVKEGMEFFESMTKVYGITPRMEHYACAVDMLGRAGNLNEAKNFIESLPIDPGIQVWQALLGACSIHGDSHVGKYAAEKLISASPESITPYILMSNIYSSEGRWEERAKAIKKMKEIGMKKETGMSWIEIEKELHSFVVEDRLHPKTEIIHNVLVELTNQMRDEGYAPNRKYLL